MTDKDRYRALCEAGEAIPVYSQYWWLDALCGEKNWDVALVEKGGVILGSLPYYSKKVLGYRIICHPKLTAFMGPFISCSPKKKYADKLSHEHFVLEELIGRLPKNIGLIQQSIHYTILNGLPFYWNGFDLGIKYTYRLTGLSNMENIWSGFSKNLRNRIHKSKRLVTVRSDLSIEQFLHLNELTYKRQGTTAAYSPDHVRAMHAACMEHNACRMFFAEDAKGRLHSAVYAIWDGQTVYLIMAGSDPELRDSGANALLVWSAINFAAENGKEFNFAGSMIRPVERFFRDFGAVQQPYLFVRRATKPVKFLLEMRGHPVSPRSR